MRIPTVDLAFRGNKIPLQPERHSSTWPSYSAEHCLHAEKQEVEFCFSGASDYLAIHDMQMSDGAISLDGRASSQVLNLKKKITFIPKGCSVAGWSRFTGGANSFTAIYFEHELFHERFGDSTPAPMLYFENDSLHATVTKVKRLLLEPEGADPLYAELLGLIALFELARVQKHPKPGKVASARTFSKSQQKLLQRYIEDRLHDKITLGELAAVVNLEKFHFLRSFKKSFGMPPHRYLLMRRIEVAKEYLRGTPISAAEIAQLLGFTSAAHFSNTFRNYVGCTPLQFRTKISR